jgi:hypothetical protein
VIVLLKREKTSQTDSKGCPYLCAKLLVSNPKGKTRLEPAIMTSKFAREHDNALRNHVHVRSYWIKNKGDIR